VALIAGCNERERLTFSAPDDGIGPVTTIDQPNGADTTIFQGSDFSVNGQTTDPDGVDTVYFFVNGGNQNFHPITPLAPTNTIRFGIPLTTFGHSGETFEVQVYGVDTQGNQGAISSRHIHIR
jgi:Big-like domain-containing protein